MIADLSDYDIWRLDRGGHDAQKVYAAYAAAVKHKGQPTVILAKTVKGYGMGEAGEGQNITHQQKKMGRKRSRRSATVSSCRSPTRRSPRRRTTGRPRTALRSVHPRAASGPRRLSATTAQQGRTASSPTSARSTLSSSRAATASSRRRWRSSACSPRCFATSRSASTWCRSSPTRRARSAWRDCSVSSASTRRKGSSTGRKTPSS